MPAVTVDDVLTLPRVARPDPATATERPVLSVTTAPAGLEGEGFPVRRAFAGVDQVHLDPFVHMDQMGEVEYAPGEPKGTPWHPHRGFETVTYMIDGTFQHQDSIGGGGLITNGDTQWMTAGGGILHIEAPPEDLVASGGLFHGIQLWVNLPRADKMIAPRYQDIATRQRRTADHAGRRRAAPSHRRRPRWSRGTGLDALTDGHGPRHRLGRCLGDDPLAPGLQRPRLRARRRWHRGRGAAPRRHRPAGRVRGRGLADPVGVGHEAWHTTGLDVLVLGGRPIREPVFAYGPFVMNTREEVAQAFEDYQAGRLGQVPAEHIGS